MLRDRGPIHIMKKLNETAYVFHGVSTIKIQNSLHDFFFAV
jgi:hypothetical protein